MPVSPHGVSITDREQYQHYQKAAPPVIEQDDGKIIARSESPLTLEGPQETRWIGILQFPTGEKTQEFYDLPGYRKARKLREGTGDGELIVIEGFIPG